MLEQAAVDERRRQIEEARWESMSETDRARTQALHAANERERQAYVAELRAKRQREDELTGITADARRKLGQALEQIRRLVVPALTDSGALDELRQCRSEARSAREVLGGDPTPWEVDGLASLAREQLTNGGGNV